MDEALHARGFQCLDLVLGIARHQHRDGRLRADFTCQRQVFGVRTAEHDQIRVGQQVFRIDDVEAGAAEEVQAEVGARHAHFEVAAFQQQHLRIAAGLPGDLRGAGADLFERLGQARAIRRSFELGSLLHQVREIVDAHQRAPPRGERFLPRSAALRQGLRQTARGFPPGVAAFCLDLLEELPGFARQCRRERFDVIGTARGVGHGIQVSFLLEDALNVARQVRIESKRVDGEGIAAAEHRGKRFGGERAEGWYTGRRCFCCAAALWLQDAWGK